MRAWLIGVSGLLLGLIGCEPEAVRPSPGEVNTPRRSASAAAAVSLGGASTNGTGRAAGTASAGTTRPSGRPPASAAATARPARYAALSPDEVRELVNPHLVNEAIAHPPYRGPFGPSQHTIVVLTKKRGDDLGGFVLVTRGSETKKIELPVLRESWPTVSVEALGFVAECDGDSVEELVVISKHRSGQRSATVATVIDFDGYAFRRLGDVEALVAKAKSVSDVRDGLRTKTFIMRIDGVPVRILPTMRPESIRSHLEKLMGVKSKNKSDSEVWLVFSDKQGREPAEFIFSFNDSRVLQKIVVSAAGEEGDSEARNPTAKQLAAWLAKNVGKGSVEGGTTTWTHNAWTFALRQEAGDEGDSYSLGITRER